MRSIYLLTLGVAYAANPIRKVVNLLQGLRQEVEVEGANDKKAFDKAMCFCTTNDAKSTTEIEDSNARISSLEATIKELEGSNSQLTSEVADLEAEIAEDQKSVDEATKVRQDEASQYSSESMELKTNIAALDGAIPALKKGLSFIQADGTLPPNIVERIKPALQHAAQNAQSGDRDMIVSFLQGKMQAGGADQILGILEQMLDNFKENLANATKAEEDALTEYNNLMDGKTAELKAAKTESEEKKGRIAGQVQKKADAEEDLEDTRATLDSTTTYLANLRKSCKDQKNEFEANEKLRAEEVEAIQDTIKILNDDDALDMFKKTLPSPQETTPVSFIQMSAKLHRVHHYQNKKALSFVQTNMSTTGKFDKLNKMVQNMILTLTTDQKEDDKQLSWCKGETETVESQLISVKEEVKTFKQKLEEVKNEVKVASDEISVLMAEVKELDAAVAEATATRKQQQALYVQTISELNIASGLLKKASERMAQQYAPQSDENTPVLMQQKTADTETADMLGFSFIQINDKAPAQKHTGAGMSIIAMLDKLRNDIAAEQAEKKRDNMEQTKDYEEFMRDSKASRQIKKEDITNKSAAKGRAEEVLNAVKKKKNEALTEQSTILDKVSAVHQNCNFIMENHGARQEARANEIDGLKKSLAVLAGASGTNYGTAPVVQPEQPMVDLAHSQGLNFLQRRMS